MFRIIIIFSFLVSFNSSLQAQHFDPLYNNFGEEPIAKTWEDSGYYFIPILTRFQVTNITTNPSNVIALDVNIQSTDLSGLMFTGQAVLLYRAEDLPDALEIELGTLGYANVLLPQSILFCPSGEQEQGLGQEEDVFPISTVGRLNRVGTDPLPSAITLMVQVNDFTPN